MRTLAAVVAAGSVVVAAAAFQHTKEQARTTFEDAMAREYRDIAGALPPAVFFTQQVAALTEEQRQAMFRYLDLSNEQLRLIRERRIRQDTGKVWESGIEDLLRRPAFIAFWRELHTELPAEFFTALSRFRSERGLDA